MIPTKTGAAAAIGLVLPELKVKLDGSAVSVPVANVSLIDFTFTVSKKLEIISINETMINASNGYLEGILGIAAANLVSIDFNHTSYISILDPSEIKIVTPYFARVLSWYDNEWAFAQRMLDCCDILKNSYNMLMQLGDIEIKDKRLLLRLDLNLPIKAGKLTDDTRIIRSIPTIKYLVNVGAKIIIISHFGRPHEFEQQFSLEQIARQLKPVKFSRECSGIKALAVVNDLATK